MQRDLRRSTHLEGPRALSPHRERERERERERDARRVRSIKPCGRPAAALSRRRVEKASEFKLSQLLLSIKFYLVLFNSKIGIRLSSNRSKCVRNANRAPRRSGVFGIVRRNSAELAEYYWVLLSSTESVGPTQPYSVLQRWSRIECSSLFPPRDSRYSIY